MNISINSILAFSITALLVSSCCSNSGLSSTDASSITEQLIKERQQNSLAQYGVEWDNRELKNGDYSMKFDYQIFGDEPADGRAMYISMHGGGGTTPELNDKQWDNQKKLYTPTEGVYFVPRAPTNTWNLWHQEYMDGFIEKAIELAVIKENVNPNKVYIMGYSAGGDGTYQLAPRLADLWAGAAMSAGHPGDAQIKNLRNLPFALYMGGQDTPYDRNIHAQTWSDKLDSLAETDPSGYIHDVRIYKQHGHWMQHDDTVSMQWLPQFQRNPTPQKVTWLQDDVARNNFYWLEVAEEGGKQNDEIIASYNTDGQIDIISSNVKSFIIGLNDTMMNLDQPVKVVVNGNEVFNDKVQRSLKNITADINAMRDKELVFPAKLLVSEDKVTILK